MSWILIVLAVLIFGGIFLTRNLNKSGRVISKESAETQLSKMFEEIDPKYIEPVKSSLDGSTSNEVDQVELPDIDTCEIVVDPVTDQYAEIMSSPEKAGEGQDGWLVEVANLYNQAGRQVNGKPASIKVRNVNSGQGVDYIATGKYIPDGFTPSSMMWVSMLQAKGQDVDVLSESLVKNVAGLVFEKKKYQEFLDKYGSADIKSITDAVVNGDLVFGYPNPFASTAGMNFLNSLLLRYDPKDPLSDKAVAGFTEFQQNVPYVFLTTMQIRESVNKGTLDAFILEYQTYQNDGLSDKYEFVPYGYRHDNPLVCFKDTSPEKKAILSDFIEFCNTPDVSALGDTYGFDGMSDYEPEIKDIDGQMLIQGQKLYKDNKDKGKPVIAVFVTDLSESMSGEPLARLKESLINAMKYINPDNYVGIVGYSADVSILLPVGQFDLDQQMKFKGTVESLSAESLTATYDGLIVGMNLINQALADHPEAKPMLFLLSDGDNNCGYSLGDVSSVSKSLGYPIYTIGYNANIDALTKISSINEAAALNADTDDVVYQLKLLFEANM